MSGFNLSYVKIGGVNPGPRHLFIYFRFPDGTVSEPMTCVIGVPTLEDVKPVLLRIVQDTDPPVKTKILWCYVQDDGSITKGESEVWSPSMN